ncbi:hypothetical protein G9A89_010442 [Geosiphon pyriformis]|nr:hypothetical protein G9A89_010442 [Geosiphon pyriformis]
MTTTRAKSKKAAFDICPEISNKISTRGAFSVVEATKQNVLEAFFLPSNREKLPLVTTESTFSSLAGFLPVKVPSKKYTWVSSSVASTPTKSPKVFNNRSVNKLVFPFIASTFGVSSTSSSKKIVKKTKSSKNWGQLPASAIVIPNFFVVLDEILDEISITSSGTSSKMSQDQPLAVLPNVVSSGRFLPVLEAKQSSSVGLPVLGNWTDHIETKLSSPLVSGATFGVASTLVPGAIFKIKLAYVKAVFQPVHGFLNAKSVSKDNVKLFCVEFASQVSLKAAFLVKFASSVHLATLKIAKSLVVPESGFFLLLLCCVMCPWTAFGAFGSVIYVVLKPVGIWQYVVIYFKKLDSAMSALNYWSVLMSKNSIRILPLVNQNKTILFCDRFKAKLVGGQTCFIPWSPDSGHYFHFALVTFGSQANLNLAVTKTGTLRKCYIWWETSNCWHCFWFQEIDYLTVDCEVALSLFPKAPKVFKPHFVGFLSYAKVSALPVMSEFPPLVTSTLFVATVNPAVGSRLNSLEKQISDLAALVKIIVEPIGFLVALVSCLFDDNAVKAV